MCKPNAENAYYNKKEMIQIVVSFQQLFLYDLWM